MILTLKEIQALRKEFNERYPGNSIFKEWATEENDVAYPGLGIERANDVNSEFPGVYEEVTDPIKENE